MIRINKNEATAARRRVYFHLVDATDGMTPETGEAGGQPQVSVDGAAWTNTGIGTLVAIGSGRYYAELTQVLVNVDYAIIETRYKSANTAECPGDTAYVDVLIERLDAAVSSRLATSAYAAPLDATATQNATAAAITAANLVTDSDIANLIGDGGDKKLVYRVLLDSDGDGVPDVPNVGIPGVKCILTSDPEGNVQVGSAKVTDAMGYATWRGLVAGTYYVWREHPRYLFADPVIVVVA